MTTEAKLMASPHLDERTGKWIVMFRWAGRQYRKSTETQGECEDRNVRGSPPAGRSANEGST